MDASKLKTTAIIILLCVNIAFGGILIFDGINNAGAAAREKAMLAEVMAKQGVEISAGIIPTRSRFTVYTITRSVQGETELVRELIGQAQQQDQGGNIYYYENDEGWVRFRSSGSFEACLYNDGRSDEQLFELIGVRPSKFGDDHVFYIRDSEIVNCSVELTHGREGTVISGRRLMGEPTAEREEEYPGMSTILLRFLNNISSEGTVCSRIDDISPGYVMNTTAVTAELRPVWNITADSGVYCVWADSGETALE